MAARRSWKELLPGIIALSALVFIAVGVLFYARVGRLHGETGRIFVTVGEARALIKGSEVWLAGKKIGRVENIAFMPATTDTLHRIVIEVEVVERHRPKLRHDSPVQIRSGGTLIGAPVVYFDAGTISSPEVRQGDTVHAVRDPALEGLMADFGRAAGEFPAIMSNVKLLGTHLEAGTGTLGALGLEQDGTPLAAVKANASRIGSRISSGRGTVGLVMGGSGALQSRIASVMARVDSVKALLGSDETSFGRFRRDSSLIRELEDIRAELAIVNALLDEPRGTAGRAMKDSIIVRELARTSQEMTLLFADIKKRPLRYLRF